MKVPIKALVAGAFLLLAAQVFGQSYGTSHPEELNDNISTSASPMRNYSNVVTVPAAPRAANSANSSTLITIEVKQPTDNAAPQQKPSTSWATTRPQQPVETASVKRSATLSPMGNDRYDEGVVTSYPYIKNALSAGTLIKARLNESLSSKTAVVGSHFSAQLSEDVQYAGKVFFPVGTLLTGRVSAVHAGRRIHGAASIHLETDTVTLPDGTRYRLHARVIDLDEYRSSKVNTEGSIVRSDKVKGTLTALALTTGGAAAAGGVIGGAPGALIGAGVGAGLGTIWWLKRDREEALPEGTQIVFSLSRTMELIPVRNELEPSLPTRAEARF